MKSKQRFEGYLMIDHRFGAGVTQEFVHSVRGIDTPAVPEGRLFEAATYTCPHCHAIVIINKERTRPRNYCHRCDHYVCDNPMCNVTCRPFNDVIEEILTYNCNHKEVSP